MDPERRTQVPETFRLEAIGSSNDVALSLIEEDCPEHTLVVAREQVRPRGGGGPWFAPLGGLWLSTVWRPRLDACSAALLTLAAGYGVREGIRRATAVEPGLKWPNDLVIDERKLGGVLVEGRVLGHDVVACAIGVGVNVNNPVAELPGDLPDRSIALGEVLGRDVALDELLLHVREGLKEGRRLVDRPDELLRRYVSAWTQRGCEVAIDTGYTILEGTATRIDPDGALVIERDGLEHKVEDLSLAKFVCVV